MGGGGQANFTGKCTNFLNGAAFPARNGAPAHCAGAASAAGKRLASRFSPFSPLAGKRPFTAPAPRAAGPRPGICQRPPRARGAGRARGARTICTNQSPERQRGSTAPQGSTGLVRGGESRRARAGSGCAAAALWAAIQCRAYLERGVWGGSHVGSPSPSDEAPERRARGHEERVTKASSSRPATSERAAQGARAPPSRRCPAYAGRGCSEGSCCSIRCAAAWRPVVHALPRILLRVIPGW